MLNTILLTCAILLSTSAWGTTYYLASNGNDSNKGTISLSPIKTLQKLNGIDLLPGDSVLFHSGDIFHGGLTIKHSGTKEKPIVFSSYAIGPKPKITGSIVIDNWTRESGSLYSSIIDKQVFSVYQNNKRLPLARWPNKGYFKIDDGNKISLTDNTLGKNDFDLAGASARIKSVDWQSETMTVQAHENDKIIFNEKMVYSAKKDYGYFLDNKPEFMDSPGEWYFDQKESKLWIYHEGAPGKITAGVVETGILIEKGIENIFIHNLLIQKFNTACIYARKKSQNISIFNCDIRETLVYGICIEQETSDFTISDNTITDIIGRGISTLESSNLLVENNTLERIGLMPGYGFNGVNNEVAIAILKKETTYFISENTLEYLTDAEPGKEVMGAAEKLKDLPYPNIMYFQSALEERLPNHPDWVEKITERVHEEVLQQKLKSTNNTIRHNYIDSVGYIGIRLDGTHSLAEKNIVKNTILHMNDGGAIYCWAQDDDYTHHVTFRQNIVINPVGSAEATPNNRLFGIGIYVDNRCHNIIIEDNTVLEAKAGILLNDGSYNHIIRNNTTYNNLYGLMFSEYYKAGSLTGCTTEGNILFSKERHQRSLFEESRISESFSPSTYSNNFYGSPYYTYPILELTYNDQVRRYHEYTLESWQRETNQDKGSRSLAPADPEDRGNESFILINDTDKLKRFNIDKDRRCYDTSGTMLDKSVTLKPFSSLVVVME